MTKKDQRALVGQTCLEFDEDKAKAMDQAFNKVRKKFRKEPKKQEPKTLEVEYIFRILCTATGVKVTRFKIGSITAKNYVYQNGTTKRSVKKDELDTPALSKPSYDPAQNAAICYTLKNLEKDYEYKKSLMIKSLCLYRNYISEYMKLYTRLCTDNHDLEGKLFRGEMDIPIEIPLTEGGL